VPGISPSPPQKPRPKAARWRQAALGLLVAAALPVRAVETPVTPSPIPAPAAPAPVHISDEGDRMLKGTLKPEADRRSHADALYAQAMLLLEGAASVDDQERALQLFRQVVDLDPGFSDAQLKLANLLLQSGQVDEAHQRLETLYKAHPDSVPVEVELGYTQRLRGQNEEAQRVCAKALTADSSQTLAMRVILEIAAEQSDLSGGVLRIEDILRSTTDVPAAAWLNLDHLYLEFARTQFNSLTSEQVLRTRLPILRAAVSRAPGDADTWTELAKTYRGLGQKIDALAALQHACALSPNDADILSHCAELELDMARTDDAIRDYQKAYEINPDLQIIAEDGLHSQPLSNLLGALYLDNKRYDAAVIFYEKALAASPQEPGIEVDLGIAYEATHHPDKAQACFQAVFNSVSCPVEAYLELARFQLEEKENQQAGQTLTSAAQHFPQSSWVCYYQALLHRSEKDYPAALASFDQARSLAAGTEAGVLNQDFYIQDAATLDLAGKKDQSESVLRDGLGHYPDDPDLMNELAYFLAEQGTHLPEALQLSRRAGALEPDNGPIMDTRGWVYFQMGQVKDSLPYLQRAAVMTNNDPVVLQHVGDALLKLGLRREAIATWTRALAKDPHNGDLTSRIAAAEAQATNVHLRSAPKP
jgi:tetratricopeptide (TPR) repeat protein